MNIENKSGEEQPVSNQLELFLAKIANQTKDPMTKMTIERYTKPFLAENKIPITDQCFLANKIGVNFLERNAHKASVEYFQFAFLNEDPYNKNVSTYASNLINIMNILRQIHVKFGVREEDREWLEDKKPSIEAATKCLKHFRYLTIYKEGYNQVPKDKDGDIRWNTDSYNEVTEFAKFETIGENLLTQ